MLRREEVVNAVNESDFTSILQTIRNKALSQRRGNAVSARAKIVRKEEIICGSVRAPE